MSGSCTLFSKPTTSTCGRYGHILISSGGGGVGRGQPNLKPEKYAQRNRVLEGVLRRRLPGGADADAAGAAVSLDNEGLGLGDDDGEQVRDDRAALRERILTAAFDPERLQTCPEVEALALRVAAVWSPSGLDLAQPDSDDPGPPDGPDSRRQTVAPRTLGKGEGPGPAVAAAM